MKKSKALGAFVQAPLYQLSGTEILRRLAAELSVSEGASASIAQNDIARLIGIPPSTLNDWFYSDQIKPIQRFLSALERVAEERRTPFFKLVCRKCSRLSDPCFSGNAQALSAIAAFLDQASGLATVSGSSDQARTHLITAIGNSVVSRLRVSGVDFHVPNCSVPVPGVFYPKNPIIKPAEMVASCHKLWPIIHCEGPSVVVLNLPWQLTKLFARKIAACARKRLVIVAKEASPPSAWCPRGLAIHVEPRQDESGSSPFQITACLH